MIRNYLREEQEDAEKVNTDGQRAFFRLRTDSENLNLQEREERKNQRTDQNRGRQFVSFQ